MKREKASVVLNILVAIFVPVAWMIMYFSFARSGYLAAAGFYSLRYFTVLSNLFAGIVSLLFLIFYLIRRKDWSRLKETIKRFLPWKYISATAVGLTFLVVVVFLGPTARDGFLSMFYGANFFFHLTVPLLCMADIMLFYPGEERITLRMNLLSVIPMLLYGTCYLLNIIINGRGEGKYANDWYGFAKWGIPFSFVVFFIIACTAFLIGLILRLIRNRKRSG